MTNLRKLGALLLPVTAMSLSALGLTAGNAAETGVDEAAPMQCEIAITKVKYGHSYAGVLTARKTVSGFYELNLSQTGGSNAVISQSGPFQVKAGQTQTLGQAVFGGVLPQDVDAELILHIDDKTYICGADAEI